MEIFPCPKGECSDRLIICKAKLYLKSYCSVTHTADDYTVLI